MFDQPRACVLTDVYAQRPVETMWSELFVTGEPNHSASNTGDSHQSFFE